MASIGYILCLLFLIPYEVRACKKGEKFDEVKNRCVSLCKWDEKFDEAKKQCVPRCPKKDEKFDGIMRRCVPYTFCEWDKRFDEAKKRCVLLCNGDERFDEDKKRCVPFTYHWYTEVKGYTHSYGACYYNAKLPWKGINTARKCAKECNKQANCTAFVFVGVLAFTGCHLETRPCTEDKKTHKEKEINLYTKIVCKQDEKFDEAKSQCVPLCKKDEKFDEAKSQCVGLHAPRCEKGQKWHAPSSRCWPKESQHSKTTDGNGGGAGCAIPWKYKGKWISGCIPGMYNGMWCSVTEDYGTDGKWGYCPFIPVACQTQTKSTVYTGASWTYQGTEYSCGKDGKVRKTVKTSTGNCVFPFHYFGVTYEACTEAYSNTPWCTVKPDDISNGYC